MPRHEICDLTESPGLHESEKHEYKKNPTFIYHLYLRFFIKCVSSGSYKLIFNSYMFNTGTGVSIDIGTQMLSTVYFDGTDTI